MPIPKKLNILPHTSGMAGHMIFGIRCKTPQIPNEWLYLMSGRELRHVFLFLALVHLIAQSSSFSPVWLNGGVGKGRSEIKEVQIDQDRVAAWGAGGEGFIFIIKGLRGKEPSLLPLLTEDTMMHKVSWHLHKGILSFREYLTILIVIK